MYQCNTCFKEFLNKPDNFYQTNKKGIYHNTCKKCWCERYNNKAKSKRPRLKKKEAIVLLEDIDIMLLLKKHTFKQISEKTGVSMATISNIATKQMNTKSYLSEDNMGLNNEWTKLKELITYTDK